MVAKKLAELLESPVEFLEDCVGEKVEKVRNRRSILSLLMSKAVLSSSGGQVFLLENLRFHAEEVCIH